ncbi:efflux RND transporter periplasmic adaptor subunit [Altericroceibacterium endophyticum]|uniref:Efflux RND transporter periplasmic adaptor subunit n=1 Tax=Altericroceibacterium endophyticum TaxID=1808508 RepID=A0A6I4T4F7_9SPHN|nr:efflux RND transporter periplasmic adaptor subunit [Altericroceibacterium endophyticum]MXO65746.1 efflux RND transporter periplasmic adaptor subunit [Altericroceibacterium endophyticum]
MNSETGSATPVETEETLDQFLGARPGGRWRGRIKWMVAGLAIIVLLLLLARCAGGAEQPSYITQEAVRGDLAVTVSATGKLQPTNQVDVGSELSGLVTRVMVDVNDRVTKGQRLALIDPARFQDAVNQSEAMLKANIAAVAQARATLEQSRAQLNRLREVKRLSDGRVPAKTEMEAAEADYDRAVAALRSAEANVVSARATLSSDRTQLTRTVIRSPVNGVVLARQIEPGQTVAASFNTPTLFVIAEDLSQMKLEVAVDEADVGEVEQGQSATFTVDAFPGQRFPARITRVDLGSNLSADSGTSTGSTSTSQVVSYAATLSVANPDLKLRPGMTATADIAVEKRDNVLLVPNGALRFELESATSAGDGGGLQIGPGPPGGDGAEAQATIGRGSEQTIYILNDDGQPERVNVTTGASDGSQTEVTSEKLKAGMKVIVGQRATGSDG